MNYVLFGALVYVICYFVILDNKANFADKQHELRQQLFELQDVLDDMRSTQIRKLRHRPNPAYAALHRRTSRRTAH